MPQGEDSLSLARKLGSTQPILVARVARRWIRDKRVAGLPAVDAAAILLLSLGERVASEAFTRLTPAEVEILGGALLNHAVVSRDHLNRVLAAFLSAIKGLTILVDDPKQFLHEALSAAVGERQAHRVEAAILASQGQAVSDVLKSLSDETLAVQLRREAPQVAAVILAHLNTSRALAVIRRLEPSVSLELLSRLAATQTISPAALLDLRDALAAVLAEQDRSGAQPNTGVDAARAIVDGLYPQGPPAAWSEALRAGPVSARSGPNPATARP